MQALVQNYRNGLLELVNLDYPQCGSRELIIDTKSSLISVGTEKSMNKLAKQSLFNKARSRPDLVKRVIEKVKTEGILKTFNDVQGRLDQLVPLGYSACGFVRSVGSEVKEYQPGDFVSVIGANIASHSSVICAPEMMCLKVKPSIGDSASFGMLGVIAMHGVRISNQQSGSIMTVVGLGLLGNLMLQILRVYGYITIGYDPDEEKVRVAKDLKIENCFSDKQKYIEKLNILSANVGADATIITAATNTSGPVNDAVNYTRPGGKIVVTGNVKIHPDRNELWQKEIELVVSRAGGPGALDEVYERSGIDLPIQNARWTQKRNLKEFFRLVTNGSVNTLSLISEITHLKDALSLYKRIDNGEFKGIAPLLVYGHSKHSSQYKKNRKILNKENLVTPSEVVTDLNNSPKIVDFIGAGQFAKSSLLPLLAKRKDIKLGSLVTKTQISAFSTFKKFGFQSMETKSEKLFKNIDNKNTIFIVTRHSQHTQLIVSSIKAGYKNIFVEKPLSISRDELNKVKKALENKNVNLLVGYNRRFSPHSQKVKSFFDNGTISNITYIVNAGFVSPDHWVFEAEEGRSRIVGEMCHFFDFFQYITGSLISDVSAETINTNDGIYPIKDNLTVICKMDNGAVCNLSYYSSGNRAMSRENVYIFGNGRSAFIENFSKTQFFGPEKLTTYKTIGQQIGYSEEIDCFISRSFSPQIKLSEIFNSAEVCFLVEDLIAGI